MPRPPRSRRVRKRLGQHFLRDTRVAERIVAYAALDPDDVVLEIGPGTGVLTRRLAPRCRRLLLVEYDRQLAAQLQTEFSPNPHVTLLIADASKLDYAPLGPFNKIVANLPYSVSTPITFRLLPSPFDAAILMYQKEFADRLVAEVGRKAYGRLSAARAYYASAEYLETVPPGAFQPPPRVESAIVRLRRYKQAPFPVASPARYETLLRVLFSSRRKTIAATMRHQHAALGLPDASTAQQIATSWGRGEDRPERVPPAEFGRLTLLLVEVQGHG